MSRTAAVGRSVASVRRIEQSPLDDALAVPPGTHGTVEDFDHASMLYAVDFGERYGVVLCMPEEIGEAQTGDDER